MSKKTDEEFKFNNFDDEDETEWSDAPHFTAPGGFGDGRKDGEIKAFITNKKTEEKE